MASLCELCGNGYGIGTSKIRTINNDRCILGVGGADVRFVFSEIAVKGGLRPAD